MARCRPNWQNPMFLSRNPPRFGDQPAAKTKIPTFLQLFCDCGLFSISKKRNRTAVQQITWLLRLNPQSGISKQSVIAKKLHCKPIFCFWASGDCSKTGPKQTRKGDDASRDESAQPQRRSRGGPAHRRYKMASGCPARRSAATSQKQPATTLQEKSEGIQSRMSSLCFQTILYLL